MESSPPNPTFVRPLLPAIAALLIVLVPPVARASDEEGEDAPAADAQPRGEEDEPPPPNTAEDEVEELRRRVEALEQLLRDHAPEASEPPALPAADPAPVDAGETAPDRPLLPIRIELHGYGETTFDWLDHAADPTTEGGSAPDSRGVFDLARLSLELEVDLGAGFEVEAEVEFEHGGTGAELELEYEEFGEYETKVTKGGEVLLEELYLARSFGPHLQLKVGRFYVPIGLLHNHHRPFDYLGSKRPESETTVIPGVWDELGISARVRLRWFSATVQVVSGLDSTGFSSQGWIATGQQRRFELVRVRAPAVAGRIDLHPVEGLVFGGSFYAGDTSGGRPKDDMRGIAAPLLLASAHAAVDLGPIRGRFSLVWGHLWNAAEISEKNRRLSNNLGVLRSAVADEGLSLWGEFGVDVLALALAASAHRLEPFVRIEHYDTMFRVDDDVFDNPRFQRTLIAGGLSWSWRERAGLKLDLTHRRFGSDELRPETAVRLTAAFQF